MDHTDHDCLIVTVLTHGIDGGTLYAFDAPYPCEDLYNGFLASNCLSLAGKPKIFIIQVNSIIIFLIFVTIKIITSVIGKCRSNNSLL